MRIKLLSVLLLICYTLEGQNLTLYGVSNITGILNESSGIVFIEPNKLYTHNDSGGNDEIYELDTLGNLIRTITINSANNTDWEDITKDNSNNIYIGDFGNNNNDRTNLRVYKIPSPTSFSGNSVTAQLIEFSYPDQTMFPPVPAKRNFDAEGFVWFNDSLFIFTKNRTSPFNGYCKLYKIPALIGTHVAQLCDSVFLCGTSQPECYVTSAALSPDHKNLALLNHSKIWWFSCFNGSSFFDGERTNITLNTNTQKEAIAFDNHQQIYVTDEFVSAINSGGFLYKSNIGNLLQYPVVNILQDTIFCNNCVVNVDTFLGNLTWNNGQTGPILTPTNGGWYKVTATTSNHCTLSDSVYVVVMQAANNESNKSTEFVITSQENQLISGYVSHLNDQNCELMICDITGKSIIQNSLMITETRQAFKINCNLSQGLYVISMRSKNYFASKKICILE